MVKVVVVVVVVVGVVTTAARIIGEGELQPFTRHLWAGSGWERKVALVRLTNMATATLIKCTPSLVLVPGC